MSVLFQKHVLVVGDETPQIHDIESALEREGAHIHVLACKDVTTATIDEFSIEVVFINHLHDNTHCEHLLRDLQQTRSTKVLPIFALVPEHQKTIERVLTMGAADYFTPVETVESILNKVRIVLGDSINAAGNTVIDIGDSTVATNSSGVKVLIVEDDKLLANLLAIRFSKASFPYRVNPDGAEIETDLEEFKPDVLILDLMLPGRSGFEVLEQIRANKKYKDLPVFIFSNRDGDEDKERAKQLGVSGFFVKAMTDLSDLVHNIEEVVDSTD